MHHQQDASTSSAYRPSSLGLSSAGLHTAQQAQHNAAVYIQRERCRLLCSLLLLKLGRVAMGEKVDHGYIAVA